MLLLARSAQVPDLRKALQVLGLSPDGNRYEMMERLIGYRQSRKTSTIVEASDSGEELMQRVRQTAWRWGDWGQGEAVVRVTVRAPDIGAELA